MVLMGTYYGPLYNVSEGVLYWLPQFKFLDDCLEGGPRKINICWQNYWRL